MRAVVVNLCMDNLFLEKTFDTDYAEKIIALLQLGGVCVLPTDTVYGVLANAFDKDAVEKVYAVRGRNPHKPCIVLISHIDTLSIFSVDLSDVERKFLSRIWPGPVSVVLDVDSKKLQYLHRGKNSIAFRIPKSEFLQAVLSKVGACVAPSANPEGLKVAETVAEARVYFQDFVDAYYDDGILVGKPSTLIQLKNGSILLLREGEVPFSSLVSLADSCGIGTAVNY